MRWSGYPACLLLRMPCGSVGTADTCSGRTYRGSDRHERRRQYATSRSGYCGRNFLGPHPRLMPASPNAQQQRCPVRSRGKSTGNPPKCVRDSSEILSGDMPGVFCFVPTTTGYDAAAAQSLRRTMPAACCPPPVPAARFHIRRSAHSSRCATARREAAAPCRPAACCPERAVGRIEVGDRDIVAGNIDATMRA